MSYIINKIRDNIRKYGLLVFLKRSFIKINHILNEKVRNKLYYKRYYKDLENILNKEKYKKVIVFYPFFDFNMPNFQRFQQLAIALGAQKDILFFYCTPNNIYDNVYGFKKIENNLFLTNQYRLLTKYKMDNRVMFFVSTDAKSTLQDIKDAESRNDLIIYDYVDEIHEDIIGKFSVDVIKKHKYAVKNSEIIVLATAEKLLQDVLKDRNKNVSLITNGVRVEDFILENSHYDSEKFKQLIDFKKNKKMVICYYGALAKWFDYDLVKYIANDNNIGIVLIGIDYDKTMSNSGLDKFDNVLYLGTIKYSNLKYYANQADILTIPFVVNEVTNATSPVKLFEYMALQKPIITTKLKECEKYESVYIANDYEDFKTKIYELSNLNEKQKYEYSKVLLKEANENSWKIKSEEILKVIDNYESGDAKW